MGDPKELNRIIGCKIRKERLNRKVSQERLAKVLGISHQQLQKNERGKDRTSAVRLFLISQFLEVPIDEFFLELRSHVHSRH